MSKYLFKHELSDAYMEPVSSITIIDADDNNVIIDDAKYSISKSSIDEIKALLEDNDLYLDADIISAPVFDGTLHEIGLNNKKTIDCSNLWFWNEDDAFDEVREGDSEKDIKYTKLIVDTINKIQVILNDNKIDYYILDDLEDDDEDDE